MTTGTTPIICTETNASHEYSNETYEVMCQYDAVAFNRPDQSAAIATLATEEDAEWWHEYERVTEECEAAAEEQGVDMGDVAEWLGVDWDDLGDSIDKIADELGVRQMFATEA